MKNKVILVQPKITFEANYPCSWIPYSILSFGSLLEKMDDLKVIIFDENRKSPEEFKQLIHREKKEILCIGFSIMTGGGQIGCALNLVRLAKLELTDDVPIIFGGTHVNVRPDETLKDELIDYVLYGPGQQSFPKLINALRGKTRFEDVPGLLGKQGGKIIRGKDNYLKPDTLGEYNFDLINIEDYVQSDSTISDRTINYIASQGCVYSCRFCYETNYRHKYSKMPEDIVLKDIERFVHDYKINGVKFYDADWFVDVKRSNRLIEKIKNYQISWAASINPQDVLRSLRLGEDLLKNLKDSGCKRLLMGMESGNNHVLKDIVKKNVTKEENFEVAKLISDNGILGSYTFIVGYPGETKQEQEETFEFIKRLWELPKRPETKVHIYLPYPGTALFDEAVNLGFQVPSKLEDWSKFDYYKAMTPWTDKKLEDRLQEFTLMIPKK